MSQGARIPREPGIGAMAAPMHGGLRRSPTGYPVPVEHDWGEDDSLDDRLSVSEMFLHEGGEPSSVVAIFGDLCPIGKSGAEAVRKLAKAATKVVLVDVGGSMSEPIADELFALTFPDLEDKAKLVHTKAYDPRAIDAIVTAGTSVNAFVAPGTRMAGERDGMDVTESDLVAKIKSPELERALKEPNLDAVKRLVDPHALSDESKLEALFGKPASLEESICGVSQGPSGKSGHSGSRSPWSSGKPIWGKAKDKLEDLEEDDPMDSDEREGIKRIGP